MSQPIPERVVALGARLPRDPTPGELAGRRAAVLIPLFGTSEELRIVFIQKTRDLRFHAGQVAFPGGSLEPDDTGPISAALREAREEAGIDPDTVTVLGLLPETPIPFSGYAVTCVLGWWGRPGALGTHDPGEIAAVYTIAVDDLIDPANRLTWQHPNGAKGPGFQVDGLFIWGFTAMILDGLLNLAGWSRGWDPTRVVPIPKRFYLE
jgi:8-oxo-dGTP pyrophosphatase MutT (NUDIX family)